MAYFYVKRFTVLGAKYFTHLTKYRAAPFSGPLCDGCSQGQEGQLTPARSRPPLDRHMGLGPLTQRPLTPAWPGACRISHAGQRGLREYALQMPQIPTSWGFCAVWFLQKQGQRPGLKAGCPLGGWRRNSMRVYSQRSGEEQQSSDSKRRLQRVHATDSTVPGGCRPSPREEGKHFPDPTGEAGLRGDAVRRDGLMGGGVPQLLRLLLPPSPSS